MSGVSSEVVPFHAMGWMRCGLAVGCYRVLRAQLPPLTLDVAFLAPVHVFQVFKVTMRTEQGMCKVMLWDE